MKITAAHIHAEHGRATLRATLEGGSEQDTISWYVDELTFTPQDAIGKTGRGAATAAPPARPAPTFSPEQARHPAPRIHADVAVASRTSPRGSPSRRTARSR